MTRSYFTHPAYDDYPVVGLPWDQEYVPNAFCAWRTLKMEYHRALQKKAL